MKFARKLATVVFPVIFTGMILTVFMVLACPIPEDGPNRGDGWSHVNPPPATAWLYDTANGTAWYIRSYLFVRSTPAGRANDLDDRGNIVTVLSPNTRVFAHDFHAAWSVVCRDEWWVSISLTRDGPIIGWVISTRLFCAVPGCNIPFSLEHLPYAQ